MAEDRPRQPANS